MTSTSATRARGFLKRAFARIHVPISIRNKSRATKACLGVLASGIATCGVVVYALDRSVVEASQFTARPPSYPWAFERSLGSLDHAAIRRGWTVFKNVCAACHSVTYVTFKDLVDVCFTEAEARELAAEYEIQDGPDENGEYFMRPRKLQDFVPNPYPNEEAARASNNGANPIDLTTIIPARRNGLNYIFSLLTGYQDAPAGLDLADGQAFNPYFEGGALGMPDVLYDDQVEYDDGTPAYKSQMAKDVVEFLMWTSGQEFDTRKVVCMKGIGVSLIMTVALWMIYRQKLYSHKKAAIYFLQKRKSC